MTVDFEHLSAKASKINLFNSCKCIKSLNILNLDTSKITSMYGMFEMCTEVESLDLSGFDTSKVTNTHSMFQSCFKL